MFPKGVRRRIFVFDLNTRRGLEGWNGITIDDSNDGTLLIIRGIYDRESDRAKITGLSPTPDGLFERFDQTSFNTAFEMAQG